jgi:rRNA-processing protein FCF1
LLRNPESRDIPAPDDIDIEAVILDVNALMSPFQTAINLDIELSKVLPDRVPIVPTSVIRELEMLKKKGNDWRIKAALELASKYDWVDIKGRGDAPIFNLALKKRWPVVTMDRRLRKKLLERGIPVVLLREKGRMELKEP